MSGSWPDAHTSTAGPTSALPARLSHVRAGLATAYLLAPALAGRIVTRRPRDRPDRAVVRVLGARQLAQALITGTHPTTAVLLFGAEADATHAASMVTLALVSRRWRRAALADAAIATGFAWAGTAAARPDRHPATQPGWRTARNRVADREARRLVPSRLVRSLHPDEP